MKRNSVIRINYIMYIFFFFCIKKIGRLVPERKKIKILVFNTKKNVCAVVIDCEYYCDK